MGRRAEERRRLTELRSVELYTGCSESDLRIVDGLGSEIRPAAGTRLLGEGAAARER